MMKIGFLNLSVEKKNIVKMTQLECKQRFTIFFSVIFSKVKFNYCVIIQTPSSVQNCHEVNFDQLPIREVERHFRYGHIVPGSNTNSSTWRTSGPADLCRIRSSSGTSWRSQRPAAPPRLCPPSRCCSLLSPHSG